MSEPEFEAFLRQMALSLGLSNTQKQSVAAELRDHLEQRLEELTRQGVSREDACQRALAEFGDAVTLAHDFTLPQQRLRRRQTMRYTVSSVAIVVTTFVMASFYWPVQRPEPFGQTVAQSEATASVVAKPPAVDAADAQRAEIEAKLSDRTIGLAFEDTPFTDAIQFIASELDIDIVLDRPVFEDNGIDLSNPINLQIRAGNVSAKTALRLMMRQIGMQDTIAVVIRDGFVDLTAVEQSHEVQVYNCRDLLEGVVVQRTPSGGFGGGLGGGGGSGFGGGAGAAAGGGGGMFQIAPEGTRSVMMQAAFGQLGGIEGGGLGGGALGGTDHSATTDAGAVLMHVIQEATRPTEWMQTDGNGGTITEFDGLITIGHTQQVHERVADFLKKLRAAKQTQVKN